MRICRGPGSHMRLWYGTVWCCRPRFVIKSAVVSGGVATFYLTEDGTAGGKAIFKTVHKESANFWIDNAAAQYQFGGWNLSADKKTLTINVNRLGSVLLGIIQFTAAANGDTVNMTVWGDAG